MTDFVPLKDRLDAVRERVERGAISEALEATAGNVTAAAALLKISRKSMQLKMRRWEILVKKEIATPMARVPKTPERIIRECASTAVRAGLRSGVLVQPKACEACGKHPPRGTVAHHPDYSRPLDVEWLCPTCHSAKHLTG